MAQEIKYRVHYTCPDLGLRCSKYFDQDSKQECSEFVCKLQELGCKDARVYRVPSSFEECIGSEEVAD